MPLSELDRDDNPNVVVLLLRSLVGCRAASKGQNPNVTVGTRTPHTTIRNQSRFEHMDTYVHVCVHVQISEPSHTLRTVYPRQ